MISIDGSILIVKEHPNKGVGCNSQIASEPVAAHWNRQFGGADRARTGDLLVANQVLSQLSYSPSRVCFATNEQSFNEIRRKRSFCGE